MNKKISSFFEKHPRLSIVLTAVFFVLVHGIFSFCSKIKCPGFSNKEFDLWFPYTKGQQQIFESSAGRDTITIAYVTKDPGYTTNSGYGGRTCAAYGTIQSVESTTFNTYLYISGSVGRDGKLTHVTVGVKEFQFGGSDIRDSGVVILFPQMISSSYFSSLTLGQRTYSKVQEISRDTFNIKTHGVYKAWFAQNIGLVGYEVFPGAIRYLKQ